MTVSSVQITNLRKQLGWSQEKLAAISGLSERTIQRVEKDGNCSLDAKMALASAFDLSPTELLSNQDAHESAQESAQEYVNDWGGALGLAILGLAFPLIVLLTGINGAWEVASFVTVIAGVVILSIMNYGVKETYNVFDKTSWIVRYPKKVTGLNKLIVHVNSIINNAYTVGVIATVVTALTLAVHQPEIVNTIEVFLPIVVKPVLYSILFVELWFRPYKRKLERMLSSQQ